MNVIQKLSSKVAVKIWAGFISILVIMAFIVIYSYFQISSINSKVVELEKRRVANMIASEALSLNTARQAAAVRGYLATGDEKFLKVLNDATSLVEEKMNYLNTNAQNKEKLAPVKNAVSEFKPHSPKMVSLYKEQGQKAALEYMTTVATPYYEKVINELDTYLVYQEGTMHTDIATIQNMGSMLNSMSIILLIVALVLGVIIAFVISRIIVRPLVTLTQATDKLANGDLNVEINVKSNDEVGILAKAFARMADSTNEAMTSINNAAEQVASGAQQISNSSMALSQGATEQASAIEELTSSLDEISSHTKLNAQNANEANGLAETAKTNALQGNTKMKEMLKAMDDINDSSGRIYKIIKVIDDIAFQTNILALNAAVEAARAGQHGKGFAVVAEEVRNLAVRSANAAKETTEMIEGSIKKVEGGTKIANETADALKRIVDGITKAANLVGDIAVASSEQASGLEQINQGIMQVAQVVQSNSATSEQSAAASQELAGQSEMLKAQVSRFRLKKSSRSAYGSNIMLDKYLQLRQ